MAHKSMGFSQIAGQQTRSLPVSEHRVNSIQSSSFPRTTTQGRGAPKFFMFFSLSATALTAGWTEYEDKKKQQYDGRSAAESCGGRSSLRPAVSERLSPEG
jgi:hypothetical protein